MKLVILAGGFGTRLTEETILKPKPMVLIGGKPIIWHLMKYYNTFGINEFIICCGYKGNLIKKYFADYFLHMNDIQVDLKKNHIKILEKKTEDWVITIVDTGEKTMTGGRLKRVRQYLNEETFCFTYGDGLSDIDINELIKFHKDSKKLATVTAVQQRGRFGSLSLGTDNSVSSFQEKSLGEESWVSGGYFVLEPAVIDLINDDQTVWEHEPLKSLVSNKELIAFKHRGFWQPMDTLREKNLLEELWTRNEAPWKKW